MVYTKGLLLSDKGLIFNLNQKTKGNKMKIKTIEQLRTMSADQLSEELSKATWAQIGGELSGNQLFKYQSLINDVRDELEIAHTKPTVTVSLQGAHCD